MMPVWRNTFRKLFWLITFATFVGWMTDQIILAIALVLAGYIAADWRYLIQLNQWLQKPQLQDVPHGHGIWGEVLDSIYRLHKNNLQTQLRYKNIIDRIQDSTASLNDAVLMVDSQSNLEWWNAAAKRLLKLKQSDINQPLTNLIRHPSFKTYFDEADYGEPLEIQSPFQPEISLEVQCNLFGRNDRLIVIRDVTRIKNLEAMRRDFVANVSHELRTPLTVINGYLETLDNFTEQLPKPLQRSVGQMRSQSKRMDALVNDLLLLSRLETSASDQKTAVMLSPLIRDIANDAIALSDGNHNIELELDESLGIMGRESELSSAVSNLVVNAVKYTPQGSTIRIVSWVENRTISISVSDNGPGIDPVHLPRLTERFYRVDESRNNQTGGTGLGLAIVKHVLLRHNGHLDIASELGKGSTFTCVFKKVDRSLLMGTDKAV